MNNRMQVSQWNPREVYTREIVDQRIKNCVSYRGWKHTMKLINWLNKPYGNLKVAEVGCGTGTFSLTLALLGASVTLIDFNDKVLENAKVIYGLYGCEANLVKADCLMPPPDKIRAAFDIVISGGLAEHFLGEDRERCIVFHKQLVLKDGFVYVGVPNRFSPFYWMIRLFRQLTKTWTISLEVPFSSAELKTYAKKVGFDDYYVLGNASLYRDCKVYMLGLISAIVGCLPDSLGNRLRDWKNHFRSRNIGSTNSGVCEDMKEYCLNTIKQMKDVKYPLADTLSAGIVLFASNNCLGPKCSYAEKNP